MKKQIISLLSAIIIMSVANSTLANDSTENKAVNVTAFKNNVLNLSNVNSYLKDGTTMLPLREVAEGMLNLKVKWMKDTKSIEIGEGPRWTSIKIGQNSYFFARIAPFKLSQAPEIKNGLTYVTLDFFTKVLNYEIKPKEADVLFGFIKKVIITDNSKSILVAANEENKSIDEALFHIAKNTKIVTENEDAFNIDNLKVGTKVKVLLPKMLTLSLPPQGSSERITILNTDIFIKEAKIKNDKNIKYPSVVGLEKNVEEAINSEIKKFIMSITGNDLYKDLKLGYEISYLSDEKISILFNGTFNFGTAVKQIVKSKNFDLKSGKEITFNSFFDKSPAAQEKLMRVLKKAAKEQHKIEFEAEGKEIYFRSANVVLFYYPLDDSVVSPVHLYLPVKDIQNIVNR